MRAIVRDLLGFRLCETVNKQERQQPQTRVAALRGRALQIVLGRGRWDGNYDRDGTTYTIWKFDNEPFKILLHGLRYPTFEEERFTELEVRFEGRRVLRIKWDGGRSRVVDYRSGDWEQRI